jgi:hypothetical protein
MYITIHFLGLIHAHQYNKWGLKLVCYHLSHEESQQITCMCRLAYVRWSCEIWNILIEHTCYTEVHVSSQESELLYTYMCFRDTEFTSVFTIIRLEFGNVPAVCYFEPVIVDHVVLF